MFYKSLDGSKTTQQHLELHRIFIAIFGLAENIGKASDSETHHYVTLCANVQVLCVVQAYATAIMSAQ